MERERAWLARTELDRSVPGVHAGGRFWRGLVIDVDATLVTAHSEKEGAAANTAADPSQVTDLALAQIPEPDRYGQPILIRADGAGATKAWLKHLHQLRVETAWTSTTPWGSP